MSQFQLEYSTHVRFQLGSNPANQKGHPLPLFANEKEEKLHYRRLSSRQLPPDGNKASSLWTVSLFDSTLAVTGGSNDYGNDAT